MAEDEAERFLNFVQVRGGEEFVQREVFHQLVVIVHWVVELKKG